MKVKVVKFQADLCDRLREPPICTDLHEGGYPCQSFSGMGHGLGTSDERGMLMITAAHIISRDAPRCFIIENVPDIATRKKFAPTWSALQETLKRAGYDLSWRLLQSSQHGVPQRRCRVYLVGVRDDQPRCLAAQ